MVKKTNNPRKCKRRDGTTYYSIEFRYGLAKRED